ncbi:MAG: transglycosylase family protein [bacterium]|nr:transglycosylase family protein [bacterium]
MVRPQRWLRYGMLAVAVALVFGMAGSSAGGQAPDERDARISELETLVADRDALIAAQEALLNDYRCLFNVDTQLVPGGCAGSAQPTPTPDTTPEETTSDSELPDGTTEEQWEQLRQCTSNGNYQYSNPNGINFGAYEFRQPTWNYLARLHNPQLVGVNPRDAAPADQDRMAYALYEERGWQPWPECAASLSLPTPEGTTPTDPNTFPPLPAGTTEAQWDQLIRCESQGNYQAYSSVGPFLGAFQFLQSTWNWVAGIHYPHLEGVDPRNAAPADQHRMAYALYGMQGWRPWPVCAAAFRQ